MKSASTRIFHGVSSQLPVDVVALRGEPETEGDPADSAQTLFLIRSETPLRIVPDLCMVEIGDEPGQTQYQLALQVNGEAAAETLGFALTHAYAETLIPADSKLTSRFVDWAVDESRQGSSKMPLGLADLRCDSDDIGRLSSEVYAEGEGSITPTLVTTKGDEHDEVLVGHIPLSVYLRGGENGELKASANMHDLLCSAIFEMVKLLGVARTRKTINQALKGYSFDGFLPEEDPMRKVLDEEAREEIEQLRSDLHQLEIESGLG